VQNAAAVRNQVGLIRVGETLDLSVIRKGQRVELKAEVMDQAGAEGADISPYLKGASFSETELETNRGLLKRVLVKDVAQGSPAWNTGLRKGDVILSINRVRVQSVADLAELMSQRGRNLLIKLLREDMILSILLQ
jgi:S1-C subfamily serine protease